MEVASCVANDLPRKPHVPLWECFCWLHGVVVVFSCADQAQLQTDMLADPWHPVLAFPQSDLEEDIWMYLPIGFQVNGHTEAIS